MRLQPDDAVNNRILKSAKANAAQYLFESERFEEVGHALAEAVADFTGLALTDPDNQGQKLVCVARQHLVELREVHRLRQTLDAPGF